MLLGTCVRETEEERERDLALQATTTKTHRYYSNRLGEFYIDAQLAGLVKIPAILIPGGARPGCSPTGNAHTEPPPKQRGREGAAANSCSLTSTRLKSATHSWLKERQRERETAAWMDTAPWLMLVGEKSLPENSQQGLPTLAPHFLCAALKERGCRPGRSTSERMSEFKQALQRFHIWVYFS